MDGGFTATLLGRWPDEDGPLFRFALSDDPYALMERTRPCAAAALHHARATRAEDEQRYQTVFAKNPGAVAAPTAALHFDEALLAALEARGVQRASVTLHVGAGTSNHSLCMRCSARFSAAHRLEGAGADVQRDAGALDAARAQRGEQRRRRNAAPRSARRPRPGCCANTVW